MAETNEQKRTINELDPESFIRFLEIAYSLRKAMARGEIPQTEQLKDIEPMLKQLLEYLIKNINNPNLDHTLIPFLEKVLGIRLLRQKDKKKKREEEEEEEIELNEEERARRHRLAVYEMHKLISPRRLAGETELDNFISNVQLRGIDEALRNDEGNQAAKFTKDELENLESYKAITQHLLKEDGGKGFGRGM
ncbi:MAG: DUF5394 family protein [Proteobacteria bacterium]|nr:DUF5394 family protein [Pseudomonadota bacterium]